MQGVDYLETMCPGLAVCPVRVASLEGLIRLFVRQGLLFVDSERSSVLDRLIVNSNNIIGENMDIVYQERATYR